MPNNPVYQLIDHIVRRPPLFARERGLTILVCIGKGSLAAAKIAACFSRRAPYAEINASASADVAEIVNIIINGNRENNNYFARWIRGTLLPPPRFPLTRFVLWAWSNHQPDSGANRAAYRKSLAEWRKQQVFTGPALRVMADYAGRTMTSWLPVSALATFGLQKLVDGISLALWLVSPVVAVVCALLHAALLVRGRLFYRWFYRAPYLERMKRDDLVDYAMRIGGATPGDKTLADDKARGEHQAQVERLIVTALLEDLCQAYRRRLLPWPGWGRNTYPVTVVTNADPGTGGRRFMELVNEIKVHTRQRGTLLLVASTSVPPSGQPVEPCDDRAGLIESYRTWCEKARRFHTSPYFVVGMEQEFSQPGTDERAGPLPVRPLAFWGAVALLLGVPVTMTVAATTGCGDELRWEAGQCIGHGELERMGAHELVRPVADRIEKQNALIQPDHKVFTIAYLGPLTTQRGAQFKDGQMAEVAGELAGIGAYQESYNRSKSDWKLKIVFANTGQDFLGAELAAESVAERARRDPSLVAAVGLAWSRNEVKRAVGVLTKAAVPMVNTMSTVDGIAYFDDDGKADTGEKRSPYLFRLAVVNSLQNRAVIHWLNTAEVAEGVGPRPAVAVVWQRQRGELYSEDMKNLFMKEYRGRKRDFGFTDDATLGAVMRDACASKAKVIYYTGRADFSGTLRSAWGASCERRGIHLLASDDVTGAVADEVGAKPDKHDISMSFVALTNVVLPDGQDTSLNQGQRTVREWVSDLRRISFAHASFGFDAVQAVATAFNDHRMQGGAGDIRSGVHYNLRGQSFDGATGEVSFPGHATDHDAQGREVRIMTVQAGGPIRVVGVCRPTARTAGCTWPGK